MRILIDQHFPRSLVDWFRGRGIEATHVAVILKETSPDNEIWANAQDEAFVILTKDRDFSHWAPIRRNAPQVIWWRYGNQGNAALFAMLEARWPEIAEKLAQGDMLVEVRPDGLSLG